MQAIAASGEQAVWKIRWRMVAFGKELKYFRSNALVERLDPLGVLVVIEAEHLCMSMRGVRKPGAATVTSAVRGTMAKDPATRSEAMSLLFGTRA